MSADGEVEAHSERVQARPVVVLFGALRAKAGATKELESLPVTRIDLEHRGARTLTLKRVKRGGHQHPTDTLPLVLWIDGYRINLAYPTHKVRNHVPDNAGVAKDGHQEAVGVVCLQTLKVLTRISEHWTKRRALNLEDAV